jgi:outer membrane protein assembly factor BamB
VNWQVIGASPLYANGKAYIIDFFTLVALDPLKNTGKIDATTANITWTQFLAREIYGSPAYSLGKVYANSEQMALYVLDSETGEKLSFTELGTMSISSPALYNSRLYIGGFDNCVYCYEEAPPPPPIPCAQIELSLSESTVVQGSQLYIEGRVVNVPASIPLTVSIDNPDSTTEDISLLTDVNGYFQVIYTPEILGDLTVFAWVEDGDFYYGGASDGTTLTVVAPEPPAPPDPTPAPMTDTYVLGMGAAAIVVIIVIGLVLILMMRKK